MSRFMNEPTDAQQLPPADHRILHPIDAREDRLRHDDDEAQDEDERHSSTARLGPSFVTVLLRAMSAWPS